MKAVGRFILAIPQEQTRSSKGILLPVDTKARVQRAEVESVGENVTTTLSFVAGKKTIILYDRDSAINFKDAQGANRVALLDENIIAIDYE